MNIKKSILKACAEREKKQYEAAEMAGITQPVMSKIMSRGACSLLTLEKIAKALDYSVSEFIALGE